MKKRKNNLDEMQEQELLKIEHNGCWLAFWGLLAAMIIQSIAFGNLSFRTVAGEWILFMMLAIYMAVACMRKGIWDRKLQMNTKTNLVISVIAAVAVGVFRLAMVLKFYRTAGAALGTLISMGITFAICFCALTIAMKHTQKKNAQMEEEPSDANEI